MNPEVLRRPFPPELIKTRQGQGGKTLSYIETHAVIARLNDGCDAWSFEIVRHEIVEDEVIVIGKLVADGIVKMAFGGATITRDRDGQLVELADTYKAAASDAIKKAATLLGVGLELYGASAPTNTSATVTAARPRTMTATRPDFGDRLTAKQLGAIHAVARKRGIPPTHLATIIEEKYGKPGPQHLSRGEASTLISELSATNDAAE
jgi:hypothetical protein